MRLDCPGAVHHLIVRGIERRRIFRADGDREGAAQDVDFVLSQFGSTVGAARRAYARFVRAGVQTGTPLDLEGGGLRRSTRGWALVADFLQD